MASPHAVTPAITTNGRIETALQAAAAMVVVARLEGGQHPTAEQIHKLLYFAQGLTLAEGGERMFAGHFIAAPQGPILAEFASFVAEGPADWWRRIKGHGLEFEVEGWHRIREVYLTFGRLNAFELTQASKAGTPWLKARGELAWYDRSAPEITDRDMKVHFAEMIEFGEDALIDLGVTSSPGQPEWAAAYKMAVNLKFLTNHPFFDDAEARRLRVALRFPEVPEDWSHLDTSPLEKSGRDDSFRH